MSNETPVPEAPKTPGAPAPEPETTTQIPSPAGRRWWNPDVGEFFARESTLKVLDRVVSEPAALAVGLGLFASIRWLDWWGWVEPFLTLVGLPLAAATYYEYWRAKNRRYNLVGEGEAVIVTVCVNQPVAASIQNKYGRPPDVFISTEQRLGQLFMSTEQMRDMAIHVARECLRFQHREIILVVAVPQAMAFQIGQLLGCHKFRIKVLNFAAGQFSELPIMRIDDMPG